MVLTLAYVLLVSQRASRSSRTKTFTTNGERMETPQFFQQDEISSSSSYDDLVQIDGESFHLILMPAYLPGGANTLRQMRSALLKIFQTARECEEDRKPSNGYNQERQDDMMQALNSMEGRTALLLYVYFLKKAPCYWGSVITYLMYFRREIQTTSGFGNPNSCSTDSQPNSSGSHNFQNQGVGSSGTIDLIGSSTLDLLAYDHLHSQHLIKSESSFLQPFSGQTNEYHRNTRMNYASTLTAPLESAHQQRCFENTGNGTDLSTFNGGHTSMDSSTVAAYAMMPSAFQSFRDTDALHHYQPNVFISASQNTINPSLSVTSVSQDNGGTLVTAFGAAVSSSHGGGKMFDNASNSRQQQQQCHQNNGTDVSMVSWLISSCVHVHSFLLEE